MAKIRNTIFGLALGDALGSRVQHKNFDDIMSHYSDEDLSLLTGQLDISDHTQSGFYLIKAIADIYDPTVTIASQRTIMTEYISRSFIEWKNNSTLPTTRDRDSYNAMIRLDKILDEHVGSTAFFDGANNTSKSSQPIIRSLWLGMLHAKGLLTDGELEQICTLQTAITHTNPAVIHASYITATVLSNLYTGYIQPGEVGHYITRLCVERDEDYGWSDVFHSVKLIPALEESQVFLFAPIADPATTLGMENDVAVTLAHAAMITDALYPVPETALRRAMFTGAASGSIASLTGAWIGATGENTWTGLEHILGSDCHQDLDMIAQYLAAV